ncbi:hypothetical protein Bca101_021967 [Brassica carinata]
MFVVNYMKNGIKSVASKLTRKEEKGLKWLVSKDTDCVLPTQTKPNLGSSSGFVNRTFTGNVMEFNQTDTLPNAPHSLLWILEARVNVIHGLEIMTPSSERPTTLLETAEADLYEMFGRLSKVLRSIDFATLLLILHGAMTLRMFLQLFLHKKLKPYTLHMIAALNLGSVGDCPLGAWVLFCSRKLL